MRLQMPLQHASAHRLRRHLQLQHIVEATPVGQVQPLQIVGQPEGRHRVVLKRMVDPALDAAAVALASVAIVRPVHEDILDLVEDQRRRGRTVQQVLREAEGVEACLAALRLAVGLTHRDLERLQAGGLCQHPGQLGLAGAGAAVDQDVDAPAALACRSLQVGRQDGQVLAQMSEVVQSQRRGGGLGDRVREQLDQIVLRDQQRLGQIVEQIDLELEAVGAHIVDRQQRAAAQPRLGRQRLLDLGGRARQADRQQAHRLRPVQLASLLQRLGQLAAQALQHHEVQQLALDGGQVEPIAQAGDVDRQRRVLGQSGRRRLVPIAQRLHLGQQPVQGRVGVRRALGVRGRLRVVGLGHPVAQAPLELVQREQDAQGPQLDHGRIALVEALPGQAVRDGVIGCCVHLSPRGIKMCQCAESCDRTCRIRSVAQSGSNRSVNGITNCPS